MVVTKYCDVILKFLQPDRRKTRPQDLTRLYEIILQNFAELQQLPGMEEDQEYQQEIEHKIQAYKAFRYLSIEFYLDL